MKKNPFFKVEEVIEEPKKDSSLVWKILDDLNTYKINKYNGKKILDTQELYSEEDVKKSGLSIYLLLQFIKSEPRLINIAIYLNENYKMKLYDMYLFVFFTFMYAEIGGVSWVKGKGKPKSPEDTELIQKHYRVDYHTAFKYLDRLNKKDIFEIAKIYNPKLKEGK